MASQPLTTEAIALTEKKMEMTLEDIIKMSKKNISKGKKPPRTSIKSRGYVKGITSQSNSFRVQNLSDSRSSIRQGVLARRRSNFPGSQFPITTEVARKAAAAPIRNRPINWNTPRLAPVQIKVAEGNSAAQDKQVSKQRQTLDARFAGMKEQRMRVISQQTARGGIRLNAPRSRGQQQRQQPQQQQGRTGTVSVGTHRRFNNYQRY